MTPQTLGIIIGGLVPAILYGFSGIFAKASTKAGIGLGVYLLITGIVIALSGIGFYLFMPDRTVSWQSGVHAAGLGLTWALGTGLVAVAMVHYGAPLSKLVPLYNMNTLVAVLLALWLFAEWKQVHVPQLLLGAALIVIGGTLVARA